MFNNKGFNFLYYLLYLVEHTSILNKIKINIPELKLVLYSNFHSSSEHWQYTNFICDLSNSILCIKEGKT